MKRIIASLIISLYTVFISHNLITAAPRYHCKEDSARVVELLKAVPQDDNFGLRVVGAAKALKGVPFAEAADNDASGTMVIRLDSLSQKEFLNVVLAAAKASYASTPGIHDFEKALEEVSRKKGVDDGFTSQFFYGADWIVDNVYRGNVKEMTDHFGDGSFRNKTLDYVSHHSEKYPALKDSATMEKIKIMELGYRSHRIPHQKKQSITNKSLRSNLQDGDIIMMLIPDNDFDIYDLGFISLKDGLPCLIHVSRQRGEVVEDEYPIDRLFKIENQFFYGYRWLRPQE